jgi:lipoprotein signal peptidase
MLTLPFLHMTQIPHPLPALTRMPSAVPPVQPRMARQRDRTGQGMVVLAMLSMMVALDQVTKWWAWRNVPGATINSGGDPIVGHTIGSWYSGPVTGALLDLLDFGLVSIAVWVLTRCRVPASVRLTGALMIGGWGSNLLDRLGVHYWTAPDSVRGAVDFIHIGTYDYNLADFFIIGGTPLFLLAAAYHGVRVARRPVISVVTLGAAYNGGVHADASTRTATDLDLGQLAREASRRSAA